MGSSLDETKLRRALADLDAVLEEPRAAARFEKLFAEWKRSRPKRE
jgi:hypothetical protein